MKSKYWAILIGIITAVCCICSIGYFTASGDASTATVYSQGQLVRTLRLDIDQEFEITTDTGYNRITVRDGKIAVTDASCPDHYCMQRGFCNGGSHIICLPNSLVIEFDAEQEIDGFIG